MIGAKLSDYEHHWVDHVLENESRLLALIARRAELRSYLDELQERYRAELIERFEHTSRATPSAPELKSGPWQRSSGARANGMRFHAAR